jgi:hypothetical protein
MPAIPKQDRQSSVFLTSSSSVVDHRQTNKQVIYKNNNDFPPIRPILPYPVGRSFSWNEPRGYGIPHQESYRERVR